MKEDLSADKRGVRVHCVVCGNQKKPHGRSGPMEQCFCEDGCIGHNLPPHVGGLWPGESEFEFGYPVGLIGTNWEKR